MQTLTVPASATQFVFLVEGEPHVGTVADYAKAYEQTHYAGLSISEKVWTFGPNGPESAMVWISSSGYDESDYATITFEIEFEKGDPQVASCRLDGRA